MQWLEADEVTSLWPPRPPLIVGGAARDHVRRYAICRGSIILGTTNLEVEVQPGARAAGVFLPVPAFTSISAVFSLYRQAIARDDSRMLREFVRQRDSLALRVWRAGVLLNAAVDLISLWQSGTWVVHVTSHDDRLWRWR